MSVTRIKTNQIFAGAVTNVQIATQTLTGGLFAPNLTLNSNITITGNLTVSGNTDTQSATNTYINDPLVVFNNGFTGSPTYDIGILVNRNLSATPPFGSVNAAWVWREQDQAFEGLMTTETGITTGAINNSGWANVKLGNLTANTITLTSAGGLTSTAGYFTTLNSTNFSTANAVISGGNITNTSGSFTTLAASGNTILSGNLVAANSSTSTSTTTGAAVVIGGAGIGGNLYVGGNLVVTTVGTSANLANIITTGGLFWANGVSALTSGSNYGNTQMQANLATYTVPQANVAIFTQVTQLNNNQPYYVQFSNLNTTGNTITGVNTPFQYNPGSGNLTLTSGNLVIATGGNAFISNLNVGGTDGNSIVSNTGKLGLGSISNLSVTGGTNGYAVTTNGAGVLSFSPANVIVLGANSSGSLVSNAVTLTTTTDVTDAITQLNAVLGKLVPPSPPNFPGSTALSLTTATSTGLMTTGWSQVDNSVGNAYQISAGTSFSATRVATYTTSPLAAVGPGNSGNVVVWLNNQVAYSPVNGNSFVTLNGASTGIYGNLNIVNNTDYHNINSTVTAGFWYSANIFATGNTVASGWNTVWIGDSAVGANSNPVLWYYDASAPGTPTFSNTSMALSTNAVIYSSTIPHLTSGSQWRLKGNVNNLTGDTYISTMATNLTSATASNATAISAPTTIAISTTSPVLTAPLTRNLYVGSGSVYFETTAAGIATTSFGNSTATTGPSLSVNNNYNTGVSGTSGSGFVTGVTVLYKNGTTTAIEETSIPVTTSIGSTTGARIVLTSAADAPAYTGSETLWNSTTTPLAANDATVTGWGTQGAIKCDQNNYSTGYLPVGPNLTGQASTQYFTFRFAQNALAKFNIQYTGNVANILVAAPGTTIDSTSGLSGWLRTDQTYAGSGAPGTNGGNGSNGCIVGTLPVYNAYTASNVNVSFGTVNTSGSTNHYVYVRVKLNAGQYLTTLAIQPSST